MSAAGQVRADALLPGDVEPDRARTVATVTPRGALVRVDYTDGQRRSLPADAVIVVERPAAVTPPVWALRVPMTTARRAFARGARVLVSANGADLVHVTAATVTHDATRTTWEALTADVAMWRARYPRQRFCVVDEPGARDPQTGDM